MVRTARAAKAGASVNPKAARGSQKAASVASSKKSELQPSDESEKDESPDGGDQKPEDKKWKQWSQYADSSPFPDFKRPTPQDCEEAHRVLHKMHHEAVAKEFDDENTPETIPHVLDAMIVAVLSQATGWNNAKRAMNSMKKVYGSVFAYQDIMNGGSDKLEATIRCGGLHVRKTKIIMSVLQEVKERYGKWDLDHLHDVSENDAMKELLSYKYMGPKSAGVVVSWSLKRKIFIVDTHCYRIAGLWGWRPENATREKTQSHLNVTIPEHLKFDLHFLLIAHGRTCPACIGGAKGNKSCEARKQMKLSKSAD